VEARERRLHRFGAREVRLELGFGHAERGGEVEEEVARRPRHLMEAGLPVDELRERDEEPAPPASRDHRGRALRVALDEVVVVLDPAHEVLARGAAVLERGDERGVHRRRAHELLQLLDESLRRQCDARAFEGVELREGALVRQRGVRRAADRGGHEPVGNRACRRHATRAAGDSPPQRFVPFS
jgi:hypothetical protein